MAAAATGPTTAPAIQARSVLDDSVEVASVEVIGDVVDEGEVGMGIVIELAELVMPVELVTLVEAEPVIVWLGYVTTSKEPRVDT
jgi:hypothetical protein